MVEPGASLIPINDPTLLWINSGVAALKKYFDGSIIPANPRIVNIQKSIRTNDIENVGKTARHHTFFEMMGNFSIGDYFKKEAIAYAWEFITSKKWMGFDPNQIYVSIFTSDDQAYDIWVNDIGIDPKRILRSEDNFWQIGDGPCGPNSEIYIDRGPAFDPEGLGEKLFFEELENDRYIEVWNIVFSQYNGVEGVDRSLYKELPQKNIDTGMGFERLCMVAQGVSSNYDTDIFTPILEKIATFTKLTYQQETMAYRVIADHIRTVVFALADGALFANEGRGYVLRRLLRRAVRYGLKLGIEKAFFKELVRVVVSTMSDFYPNLKEKEALIIELVQAEEARFKQTLHQGEALLLAAIKDVKVLDGQSAFTLYDTYGFPIELTQEIAEEKGVIVDMEGFKEHMQAQKQRARAARVESESMNIQSADLLAFDKPSSFVGYDLDQVEAVIIGLFKNNEEVDSLVGEGLVVLDKTVFYAESGGQIADMGILLVNGEQIDVIDVQKSAHKQHLHQVNTSIPLTINQKVVAKIDKKFREKVKANHSMAHLLQAGLKKVIGSHVNQAGSYVGDSYMRFDFTHHQKVTTQQLEAIENYMNELVFAGIDVSINYMDLEQAKASGATALFSEKYDSTVRVVTMGEASKELCGGTHVNNTKEIGFCKIISEESIGSGIRRILCKCSSDALMEYKKQIKQLETIAQILEQPSTTLLEEKVVALLHQIDTTKQQLAKLTTLQNQSLAKELLQQSVKVNGLDVMIKRFKNTSSDTLKSVIEYILKVNNEALVFFVSESEEKLLFMAGASVKANEAGFLASDLVKEAAVMTGGNGGGRKDFAQAGGKDSSKLDAVMADINKKIGVNV